MSSFKHRSLEFLAVVGFGAIPTLLDNMGKKPLSSTQKE
jgi:hypothetical protein